MSDTNSQAQTGAESSEQKKTGPRRPGLSDYFTAGRFDPSKVSGFGADVPQIDASFRGTMQYLSAVMPEAEEVFTVLANHFSKRLGITRPDTAATESVQQKQVIVDAHDLADRTEKAFASIRLDPSATNVIKQFKKLVEDSFDFTNNGALKTRYDTKIEQGAKTAEAAGKLNSPEFMNVIQQTLNNMQKLNGALAPLEKQAQPQVQSRTGMGVPYAHVHEDKDTTARLPNADYVPVDIASMKWQRANSENGLMTGGKPYFDLSGKGGPFNQTDNPDMFNDVFKFRSMGGLQHNEIEGQDFKLAGPIGGDNLRKLLGDKIGMYAIYDKDSKQIKGLALYNIEEPNGRLVHLPVPWDDQGRAILGGLPKELMKAVKEHLPSPPGGDAKPQQQDNDMATNMAVNPLQEAAQRVQTQLGFKAPAA
jgi:hypothetical protein